ncbi:S8 family serine peptidase [candidate division KSB1 bacterium]|nr:S8 family serine peptidase [candidate division KSB1 bacterium]
MMQRHSSRYNRFGRSITGMLIVLLWIGTLLYSSAFAQSASRGVAFHAGASQSQKLAIIRGPSIQPGVVEPWTQKLDAAARTLLAEHALALKKGSPFRLDAERAPLSLKRDAAGRLWIDLFIQVHHPGEAAKLDALGIQHRTQVGDIVVGRAPVEALRALADDPAVRFVEVSKRRQSLLDSSRIEIGANLVHLGTSLPQAYQGEGVIVGVVDSGIDFTHPDFKDENGSRLQYLLEFTEDGGQNVWTKSDIDHNPGSVTQRDGDGGGGHGTHVTGIAAGGGRLNLAMRGIAPRADIIFVEGTRYPDSRDSFDDADVVAGCDFIFQKAAEMGKPAVINLSIGGHAGPHDGSSLYEQALSGLTGPGKIIVASAGNEGFDFIHAGGTSVPNKFNETLLLVDQEEQLAAVEMWYEAGTISRVGIAAYEKGQNGKPDSLLALTPPLAVGQDAGGVFAIDGDTLGYVTIYAKTTTDPRNGDGEVLFIITENDNSNIDISKVIWSVFSVGPTAGRLDLWMLTAGQFYDQIVGFQDETEMPGDNDYSVGETATAKKVIAVGSYVTKNKWVDVDGNQNEWLNPNPNRVGDPVVLVLGQRSYFSSMGPTRDGRTSPHIAAPGEVIFSALSSHLTEGQGYNRVEVLQGGGYQLFAGTSMSSPHVAGVVALMLQAAPTLTYEKVLKILQETARVDQQTGSVPNNLFGAGRLDALAAVRRAVGEIGAPTTLRHFDPQSAQRVWTVERVFPLDSGFVFGTNRFGDLAKATAFKLPAGVPQAQVTEIKVWFGYKRTGLTNQTYRLEIYNGDAANGPQGAAIYSQSYTLASVLADNDLQTPEQPTVFSLSQSVTVGSSFFVAANFGTYSREDWAAAAIVATNRLGRRVTEDWEQWSDGTWHNVSDVWFGQNSTPGSGTDGWQMWIEATVSTVTSVNEAGGVSLPKAMELAQNYPNPFNPETNIRYELPHNGNVTLAVFDLTGRRVATLESGPKVAGQHLVRWNGRNSKGARVPSGVYFYRLETASPAGMVTILTKKMIVMK